MTTLKDWEAKDDTIWEAYIGNGATYPSLFDVNNQYTRQLAALEARKNQIDKHILSLQSGEIKQQNGNNHITLLNALTAKLGDFISEMREIDPTHETVMAIRSYHKLLISDKQQLDENTKNFKTALRKLELYVVNKNVVILNIAKALFSLTLMAVGVLGICFGAGAEWLLAKHAPLSAPIPSTTPGGVIASAWVVGMGTLSYFSGGVVLVGSALAGYAGFSLFKSSASLLKKEYQKHKKPEGCVNAATVANEAMQPLRPKPKP